MSTPNVKIHEPNGFKNQIRPVGYGLIWFNGLSRPRVGLASNWVNRRSDEPANSLHDSTHFFPLSSKQRRFDAFDHEATSFNNYKSFIFLSPTPAVANPTHRPFPQPRPPLPSLHPVAVGAGSTRPACHRR